MAAPINAQAAGHSGAAAVVTSVEATPEAPFTGYGYRGATAIAAATDIGRLRLPRRLLRLSRRLRLGLVGLAAGGLFLATLPLYYSTLWWTACRTTTPTTTTTSGMAQPTATAPWRTTGGFRQESGQYSGNQNAGNQYPGSGQYGLLRVAPICSSIRRMRRLSSSRRRQAGM